MFGGAEYRRFFRATAAALLLAAGVAVAPTSSLAAPATALTGWIESTITAADTGAPIEGACLSAPSTIGDPALDPLGCSDSDGHIQTPMLPPGHYDLFVSLPEGVPYYPQSASGAHVIDSSLVAVVGGMATTRNFELERGGSISGTVVSDGDGSPLIGVRVQGPASSTFTDASGHYVLGPLPTGPTSLSFVASDGVHVSETYDDQQYAGAVRTLVDVVEGEDTQISVGLAVGLVVTGTLIDDLGDPVPGGCVEASTFQHPPVCADALGQYTLGGFRPGPVIVQATAEGYSQGAGGMNIPTSGLVVPPITMIRLGTVTGHVRNAVGGAAISGGSVELVVTPYVPRATAPVGADGAFTLPDLEPGRAYRIVYRPPVGSLFASRYYGNVYPFELAAVVSISEPGEVLTDVDIDVETGGVLSGRVVDAAGDPISGAQVGVSGTNWVGAGVIMTQLTGVDGTFSVPGLPTGAHFVSVSEPVDVIPRYRGVDYEDSAGEQQIPVTTGTTTDLGDITLERLGRITGTVTDAALGIPVPGVAAAYDASTGQYVGDGSVVDGTYAIDLAPGSYLVKVWPHGGFGPMYFSQQTAHGQGTSVVVAAGEVNDAIDFVLTPAGPGFSGLQAPQRLVDTRPGLLGLLEQPANDIGLPMVAGVARRFVVSDADVPVESGVALTVTAVSPSKDGHLVVYPCATALDAPPPTSTVNMRAGVTIANSIVLQTGLDGGICVLASVATHVILDATGSLGEGFVGVASPVRAIDTRAGRQGSAELPGGSIGQDVTVPISPTFGPYGRSIGLSGAGVPDSVTGYAVNITVVSPGASGWLSIERCPTLIPDSESASQPPRPEFLLPGLTSTVNFAKGVTVANSAVVSPTVCIRSSATIHLIVDITGYFEFGVGTHSARRLLDTRPGSVGAIEERTGSVGHDLVDQLSPGVPQRFVIDTSVRDEPTIQTGRYALNLTAVGATGKGHVTAYPCSSATDPVPATSSLNYVAGMNQAATVYLDVGAGEGLCVVSSRAVHLLIDRATTFS